VGVGSVVRHGAGACVAALGLASAAPAGAADVPVSAPLDLASGFTTTHPPQAFAGGVRAALLARLGRDGTALAGLAGGWLHDDRSNTWAGGVRLGTRVPGLSVRDAGAFLFVEALRGRGRTPVSLMLTVDLPLRPALFARFGAAFTRDYDRRRDELSLTIGVDLARWAVDLFGDRGPHRLAAP
jgi:hypothetical protein